MTQQQTGAKSGAYFYFDMFRFVAATLVVLEHARDLLWIGFDREAGAGALYKAAYFVTGFGHEAVMVFFVLSGFWITATVDRRLAQAPQAGDRFWTDYLIDRLSRLLIVLVPALVVGGLLDGIGALWLEGRLYTGASGASSMLQSVLPRLDPWVFLGNLLFLQTLVVPTFGSNGPLWSLTNEFWYYVWYPALMLLFVRRRVHGLLAALALAAIWPKLLPGFAIWLLGSALYHAEKRGIGAAVGRAGAWTAFAAGLALLAASLVLARFQTLPGDLSDLFVAVSFTVLLWSLLRIDPKPLAVAAPFARYGAQASFSLYVCHYPFLALVVTALFPAARLAPGPAALAVLVALILGALAYGWLFARATEARTPALRRVLKALSARRAAAA